MNGNGGRMYGVCKNITYGKLNFSSSEFDRKQISPFSPFDKQVHFHHLSVWPGLLCCIVIWSQLDECIAGIHGGKEVGNGNCGPFKWTLPQLLQSLILNLRLNLVHYLLFFPFISH